jgi:hypothetical protein
MGSVETSTVSSSPCLCGKGKILYQHSTPDDPWSKDYYSYDLSCPVCENEWEIYGEQLVHKADKEKSLALSAKRSASEKAIRTMMYDELNTYFAKIRHMTRQREMMIAYSLHPPNIEQFRDAMKRGKTHADLCLLPGDTKWLMSLALDEQTKSNLASLLKEHAVNDSAYNEFVVRKEPFPSKAD